MKDRYPLQWLDTLITTTLYPSKQVSKALSDEDIDKFIVQVATEQENIRSLLMQQLFSTPNAVSLELFIQGYQSSLISLLASLDYDRKNAPSSHKKLSELFDILQSALTGLLYFIETYFSKYFDPDQRVPSVYLHIIARHWQQQLNQLRDRWKSKEEEGVLPILDEVLKDFIHSASSTLSYRQVLYARDLFNELLALQDRNDPMSLFSPLHRMLVYLNFNHAGFTSLLIQLLRKSLDSFTNTKEKIEVLYSYQAMAAVQPVKPSVAFNPSLPSVIITLTRWISDEIRLQQEDNIPVNTLLPIQPSPKNSNGKIQLSVSVAMLGLLTRLLVEDEIITNTNQSEVVRFFAAHFSTIKQKNISNDSLQGSYYKPQPGTVRLMNELLIRLQKVLNDRF